MNSFLRSLLVKGGSLFLMAVGLLARPASAATPGGGEFTLPVPARWGRAILSPGNYTYTFVSVDSARIITVEKQPGNVPVALVLAQSEVAEPQSDRDSMTLEWTNGEFVITTLQLPSSALTLNYSAPPAAKKLAAQKLGGDNMATGLGQ